MGIRFVQISGIDALRVTTGSGDKGVNDDEHGILHDTGVYVSDLQDSSKPEFK